jgi:hypothetical protein
MYATNRRGPDRRDPAEDAGVDNRHSADQLLQYWRAFVALSLAVSATNTRAAPGQPLK